MNVELSSEAAERIDRLVRAGEFPSAAAVLDAALDALEVPRPWTDEEMLARVAPARESVRAGFGRDAMEVSHEVRAMIARKAAQRRV